jgi:hypothetical protein
MRKRFLEGHEEAGRLYEMTNLAKDNKWQNRLETSMLSLYLDRRLIVEKVGVLVVSYGAREA